MPTATVPTDARAERLDGVVIGVLVDLPDPATPLVAFPGNPTESGLPARSTAKLESADIGRQVALMFENGDPRRPLVIGLIQQPGQEQSVIAEIDRERLELSAEREIVLKCGKASITLTKAGKVILRGAYVLSRSSGVNRIKGGSVQIN